MGNKNVSKQNSSDYYTPSIKSFDSGYRFNRINELITGYIKSIIIINIPNDIINIIEMFVGKSNLVLFNVYQSNQQEWKSMINIKNNCTSMYINGPTLFLMNNNNKLYIYPEKPNKKQNIFFKDKYIIITSQGASNYVAYVQTKNELFAFRNNVSDNKYDTKPVLIEYVFPSKISQIKSGYSHSLFLTENGNVYGCGSNLHGQLINKDIKVYNYKTFHCIIDSNNIIHIDCSSESSAIVGYFDIH